MRIIQIKKRSLQRQSPAAGRIRPVCRHKGRNIYFLTNERELVALGGFDFDWAGPGFYYESIAYEGLPILGPAQYTDEARSLVEAELHFVTPRGEC